MKRLVKTTLALCAVCMLASCASGKGNDSSDNEVSDVYETETSETLKDKNISAQKANQKRKNSFALGDMFSSKYTEFGDSGSVYTPKTFGGKKQELATFVIYPKTDTAGFGSHYMGAYYYITFDDSSRQFLTKAMNTYLKDFEEKKLNRNDKKSFKVYGKIPAIVRWGALKANNPYYSQDAVLVLGYKFENNSPYFSIQMEPVYDEGTSQTANDANDILYSMRLLYTLTKNQCRGFIENLSDEKVSEAYITYNNNAFGIPEENDFYFEDEVEEVE